MWEMTPWMVGGGAKHSANVARLLAYTAHGGEEGIVGARDLEVTARPVPGAGIRVWPGACGILNRGQGITYEAYAARNPTVDDTIGISPTGGAARTDLVIARVENPFQAGEPWTPPTAAAIEAGTAQFVYTRVVSGVAAGIRTVEELGLGFSAIPLARVAMPASTATVQQSYITDLRALMNPKRYERNHIAAMTNTNPRVLTQDSFVAWPSEMNLSVEVPAWATHATMEAVLGGVRYGASGNNGGAGWGAAGTLRIILGTILGASTTYNVSNEGGVDRTTLLTAVPTVAVPRAMRGTTQTARIQGTKSTGSTDLRADAGTIGTLRVVFTQAPETNLT